MEFVKPRVYKIAQTQLIDNNIVAWLKDLGGDACLAHITGKDPEQLVELAGRRCYKSFDVGLNPNVTKVRTDSEEYHENIKKSGHGSVMEHSTVTFAFENISRVFTHELVRHRVGAAISQESLRFVRLDNIKFWIPNVFAKYGKEKDERVLKLISKVLAVAEEAQSELMDIFKEEMNGPFEQKKVLTSAFRRLAPEGLATGIVETFNFRTCRHILEMRTSPHAEEEMLVVIGQMAEILKESFPLVFGDYVDEQDRNFPNLKNYSTQYKKI